jgi:gliding motility-associated lipoprotein GldD
MRNLYFLFCILFFVSCEQETTPKPTAYLSLVYPEKAYQKLPISKPYSFLVLENSKLIDEKKGWLKIQYPALKASIDITYRKVDNNLLELLTEAEKLVFKHTLKAEEIISTDFLNANKRVFGSMYEITGNAASQIQFHATDSTNNFLKGSLYFYTKPNYDSILPAVTYIKKDILRIIETLEWKND